jgi:hypothetical protein
VWTYAVADALVEKRVWMEPGANTTYVRYRALRARSPIGLQLKILVNYRDYHSTTHGEGWRMDVATVTHGLCVVAFEGARPLLLLTDRGEARSAHTWYQSFELRRERERGLDAVEDHLHAATFQASLEPGEALTVVLCAEAARRRLSPGHGVGLAPRPVRARPVQGLRRRRDGALVPGAAGRSPPAWHELSRA